MRMLLGIGAVICLTIGADALRGAIDTGWEGYVSPPLKVSDLFIEIFYICFSFIPVILLIWKLNTKKWQTFMVGTMEVIVITSTVYSIVDVMNHGH